MTVCAWYWHIVGTLVLLIHFFTRSRIGVEANLLPKVEPQIDSLPGLTLHTFSTPMFWPTSAFISQHIWISQHTNAMGTIICSHQSSLYQILTFTSSLQETQHPKVNTERKAFKKICMLNCQHKPWPRLLAVLTKWQAGPNIWLFQSSHKKDNKMNVWWEKCFYGNLCNSNFSWWFNIRFYNRVVK